MLPYREGSPEEGAEVEVVELKDSWDICFVVDWSRRLPKQEKRLTSWFGTQPEL